MCIGWKETVDYFLSLFHTHGSEQLLGTPLLVSKFSSTGWIYTHANWHKIVFVSISEGTVLIFFKHSFHGVLPLKIKQVFIQNISFFAFFFWSPKQQESPQTYGLGPHYVRNIS